MCLLEMKAPKPIDYFKFFMKKNTKAINIEGILTISGMKIIEQGKILLI